MKWILLLLLAGCQTPEPRILTIKEPIEIKVAVPVPCISDVPPRPALMKDQDILALGDYQAILALRRNLLQMEAYLAELQAILLGCRAAPRV